MSHEYISARAASVVTARVRRLRRETPYGYAIDTIDSHDPTTRYTMIHVDRPFTAKNQGVRRTLLSVFLVVDFLLVAHLAVAAAGIA